MTAHSVDREFVERFWSFILAGEYERWEKGEGEPVRYRFQKPKQAEYPAMLELLGRPLCDPPEGQATVLMPGGEDLSDLSVILLDEDILQVVRTEQQVINGVTCLTPFGLILLKARAYLDLTARRAAGETIYSVDMKKHRNDVFRMAALLKGDSDFSAPESTLQSLRQFLSAVEADIDTHPHILASLNDIPGGGMQERIRDLRDSI